LAAIAALAVASAPGAHAQQLMVYPTKGQSPAQTQRDQAECSVWAQQQTGFNPYAAAPPAASGQPSGGIARGAVRGGLAGLAVGAIAGDAGKGAAIGAVGGGLIGGFRQRDWAMQQQAAQQQAAQLRQQQVAAFNRALGACLEGRGYSVR
jgi:hypothetical protein